MVFSISGQTKKKTIEEVFLEDLGHKLDHWTH